jgi:hypothetical protein
MYLGSRFPCGKKGSAVGDCQLHIIMQCYDLKETLARDNAACAQ